MRRSSYITLTRFRNTFTFARGTSFHRIGGSPKNERIPRPDDTFPHSAPITAAALKGVGVTRLRRCLRGEARSVHVRFLRRECSCTCHSHGEQSANGAQLGVSRAGEETAGASGCAATLVHSQGLAVCASKGALSTLSISPILKFFRMLFGGSSK